MQVKNRCGTATFGAPRCSAPPLIVSAGTVFRYGIFSAGLRQPAQDDDVAMGDFARHNGGVAVSVSTINIGN
jgi:hypothetical protein